MAREAFTNEYTAPILVLSLGQAEREVESFGPRVLAELTQRYRYAGGFVEFVDGGADGLELLHLFAGRKIIVVLDAISSCQEPGTVEVLEGTEVLRYVNGDSPETHAGDVHELFSTAAFLGELPENFYLVGIQPDEGRRLNAAAGALQGTLQTATVLAQRIIDHWLVELAEPVSA